MQLRSDRRVKLEAFDTTVKAVYNLTHTATPIARQRFFPPDCHDAGPYPDPVAVQLLTQLTLPDGSAYKMDYETASTSQKISGGILSLRLPTGGEFQWQYQFIDFLSQAPEILGDSPVKSAWGVSKKEIFEEFGNPSSKIGEWDYVYVSIGNPSAPGDPGAIPCFHTVTVTDPLGHATVNYFDTATGGFSRWQYGLPFRRCDNSGMGLAPPYLSQEIYDGDPQTGELLRQVYVDYDSDGRDAGAHQEKNHRLRLRRVEYQDDPGRNKQVEFSDFDGLGHTTAR